MTNDLAKRLREYAKKYRSLSLHLSDDCNIAAAAIEELEAKIERMRPSEEALEIAKTCSKYWDADDAYLMAREILRIDK